jgi:hypothetical protein
MSERIAQSSCSTSNTFDTLEAELDETSGSLERTVSTQWQRAKKDVDEAEDHASASLANLGGAAVNTALAGAKNAKGNLELVKAGGRAAIAGTLAVAGAATWAAEEVVAAGRAVAKQAARGFAGIANGLSRLLGDGKSVTVREVETDPTGERTSARLFSAAGGQLSKSKESVRAAWASWVQAVGHVAGATANVGLAAGHAAGVAGNLTTAAAHSGGAAAAKLGATGVRLSQSAVRAAEKGVETARDLTVSSARFSAATANVLAQPDQPRIELAAHRQLIACGQWAY